VSGELPPGVRRVVTACRWFILIVGIPLALLVMLWLPPVGVLLFIVALLWSVVPRTRRANECPKCRYDQTGLSVGQPCPECGEPVLPIEERLRA
jgi:hypothetical protein